MSLIPRRFYLGDDFLDGFFDTEIKQQVKCDIYEKDGIYNIEMDVPGYNKENINIECDNGYLTISAETSSKDESKDKNYIRRERHYGKFSRSFYVGDVNPETIEASFKDGILKVTVPKFEEINTKKQIEIK